MTFGTGQDTGQGAGTNSGQNAGHDFGRDSGQDFARGAASLRQAGVWQAGVWRAGLARLRAGARAGRRALVALVAGVGVMLAVACTPLYSNHGYVPSDEDLAGITTGIDTRETVGAFLGRPSVEGLLGDTEWFYVQSRWKTFGGREPQEIDRQVLAISFDAAGKVANIERFGLEKGEVVAISRRVTTEPIKGRSALAQIFANVGRIDPAALLQ